MFRALLEDAVRRCVRDGAFVCNLSGGLDSAVIAAIAAGAGARVTAYTIADDFARDGEVERAAAMARRVGARHHVLRVSDEDLPEAAEGAIRGGGVAIVNGRAIASFLLYRRIAGDGVGAVASGVGADEVFCGDPARLDPGPTGIPPWLARLREEDQLAGAPARAIGPLESIDASERAFFTEVFPTLTLPMEQRMAAAHGVTVQLPYLDDPLRSALLALPVAERAPGGRGKALLRALAEGLVPDEILAREKTARYAPAGGATPRARARWRAFYDRWIAPSHRPLLDDWARRDLTDPRRQAIDRVLLRSASQQILDGEAPA